MVLVMFAAIWLFIGPGLSLKAGSSRTAPQQSGSTMPHNLSTNNLAIKNERISTIDNESKQPDLTIDSAGHPTVEQAEKIKTEKFHIISEGETLSDISYKYYGSANKWRTILEANRETIKDVNKLKPGTKIIVPE